MAASRPTMFEREFGGQQSVDLETAGALTFTSEGHSLEAVRPARERGPPAATRFAFAMTTEGEMDETDLFPLEHHERDTTALPSAITSGGEMNEADSFSPERYESGTTELPSGITSGGDVAEAGGNPPGRTQSQQAAGAFAGTGQGTSSGSGIGEPGYSGPLKRKASGELERQTATRYRGEPFQEKSDMRTHVLYCDASVGRNEFDRPTGIAVVESTIPHNHWRYHAQHIPPPLGQGRDCSTCAEMQAVNLGLFTAIFSINNSQNHVIIVTDCARAIQRIRDVLGLPMVPNGDKKFDSSMLPDPFRTQIRKSMGVPPMEQNWNSSYFLGEWAITTATVGMIFWLHHHMKRKVEIVWVPSHQGRCEGNERADMVANYARIRGEEHRTRDNPHDRLMWYLWQRDVLSAEQWYFPGGVRDSKVYLAGCEWETTRPVADYGQTMPRGYIEESIRDYASEHQRRHGTHRRDEPGNPWGRRM